MPRQIVRCVSCDGFGWFEDDFTGETENCEWCGGVGYVYRNDDNTDSHIPASDFQVVAEELERLEAERMQEMGYQGSARKPWQQDIRKDTRLGQNPYDIEDTDNEQYDK